MEQHNKKRGGRKKGSQNKLTIAAKDLITDVAGMLGGTIGLYKWTQSDPENLTLFWSRIYPRLIPVQISGDSNNPVAFSITFTDAQK